MLMEFMKRFLSLDILTHMAFAVGIGMIIGSYLNDMESVYLGLSLALVALALEFFTPLGKKKGGPMTPPSNPQV